MIGKRGIFGLAILAFIGASIGLLALGIDLPTSIGSGFSVSFVVGVVASFWGVHNNGVDVQSLLKDTLYSNVVYGTPASEVMELRERQEKT